MYFDLFRFAHGAIRSNLDNGTCGAGNDNRDEEASVISLSLNLLYLIVLYVLLGYNDTLHTARCHQDNGCEASNHTDCSKC